MHKRITILLEWLVVATAGVFGDDPIGIQTMRVYAALRGSGCNGILRMKSWLSLRRWNKEVCEIYNDKEVAPGECCLFRMSAFAELPLYFGHQPREMQLAAEECGAVSVE